MFTLIENGDVYGPEPLGRTSVLLVDSKIQKIGNVDTRAIEKLEVPFEVIDANMVSFHVTGRHSAITHAAEAGQLELKVMMPYVAYALLESLQIVRNAIATFDEKCVRLIKAHPEKLREYSQRSVGRAGLYNKERGFMGAAKLAQEAIEGGKSVEEVVAEE